MNKRISSLVLIFMFLGLSGCVTNQYKKIGTGMTIGGYDETKVRDGEYKVLFQGQGNDANEANVYPFFLRRCADLAKLEGAPYFKIIDGHSGSDIRPVLYASSSTPNYSGNVVMLKANEPGAFNTEEVLKRPLK